MKFRDFYDITYLSSRTKPDMGFLNQKLGIDTVERLRTEISVRIAAYDFKNLSDDVAPFLMSMEDAKRVEKFREFWKQVVLE